MICRRSGRAYTSEDAEWQHRFGYIIMKEVNGVETTGNTKRSETPGYGGCGGGVPSKANWDMLDLIGYIYRTRRVAIGIQKTAHLFQPLSVRTK
jgi:hypothetical protein